MVDYREFCGRFKRKIAVNIAISIGTREGRGRGEQDKLESLDGNTNLRFRPATFSQPYFGNFLALVCRVASITIVIVPRNCAFGTRARKFSRSLLINRESSGIDSARPTCFPIPKYLEKCRERRCNEIG